MFEVGVHFQSERDTPLTAALDALRSLDIDAPTAEAAEHYGDLIVKALAQAVDEWWKR